MLKALTKRWPALLVLIGAGLVLYAGLRIFDWYSTTQGIASPPQAQQIVTRSDATPDERPVAADATYDVPADQPKKILIPSIETEGFIEKIGKDKHQELGTPSNVNYAGWFVGSVLPGNTGLSIIDGHVSGRYSSAIFGRLTTLTKGAIVSVQFGDDSLRSFEVVDKYELPTAQAATRLFQKEPAIKAQLNLITCGGLYDKQSAQYTHRVVVVTRRVD